MINPFFLGALLLPGSLAAQVVLFPHGGGLPGEIAPFLAGAQGALASGPEAVWFNPAGLAKEGRTKVTAGASLLDSSHPFLGGARGEVSGVAPGFLSLGGSFTRRGSFPQINYGFFFSETGNHEFRVPLDRREVADQSALPPTQVGPGNLNALFPNGIGVAHRATGVGKLEVTAPGVAIGMAFAKWIRLGLSIRLENVVLAERSETVRTFFAVGAPGSGTSLAGFAHTSALLEGESERLVYTLGLQVDFGDSVSTGLTVRLPSEHRKGQGRVFLAQSSSLRVTQAGQNVQDSVAFSVIDASNVKFRLESPLETRLGIAFLFRGVVVEVDAIRVDDQDAYQVFPAQQSGPPSTQATQLPALRTSGEAVTRYAAGMAVKLGRDTSLLLGLATDESAVPEGDPLFTRIDLVTFATGFFFAQGPFSAAFGVTLTVGDAGPSQVPQPGSATPLAATVAYESFSLRLGGSYLF
ncbi:MAG: hypothetical protein IIA14_01860 [SAR324 cluster bacterium]|nr:hypothetical protein [SAR324 cluster bacterium]